MSIEIQLLISSVVLGSIHSVAASHASSLQRGYHWTASARDEILLPLSGIVGRLERALGNFLETFSLFAAPILAIELTGRHGSLSEWAAMLFLGARLAYLPLYAVGVPLVRSLIWNVAAAGIGMQIAALLRY